jgi:F0F1-type ATP synthase membrane subunit a
MILWSRFLNRNVVVSLFQHRVLLRYFVLVWLTFFVIVRIIGGSVPFNFIFGVKGFIIFNLSWKVWFRRFYARSLLKMRFYIGIRIFVLFLFLFDSFVVLLRPVTLTLRVFINVSLGHFLIVIIHLRALWSLFLVYLIEVFVYVVQSYVYLTLSKSYLEALS